MLKIPLFKQKFTETENQDGKLLYPQKDTVLANWHPPKKEKRKEGT